MLYDVFAAKQKPRKRFGVHGKYNLHDQSFTDRITRKTYFKRYYITDRQRLYKIELGNGVS